MERRPRKGLVGGMWRIAFVAAAMMGLLCWAQAITRAEEKTSVSVRSSQGKEEGSVDRKLTEVLENQQKILKQLDAVLEELKIVKIRATMGR